MIVTCGKCDTQFRLDEAKVGPDGLRVRCSICKHAFLVGSSASAPPAGPEDAARERMDEIAQQAVEAASDVVPEVTRDLEDAWDESAFGDLSDEPAADLGDPTEEIDWAFDEDAGADGEPAPAQDSEGAGAGEGGELGSPEDWNFFAEDGDGAGPAERAPVAAQGPAHSKAPQRRAPRVAEVELEDGPDRGRETSWPGRIVEGLGWASVAALFVVGLHTGVAPAPIPTRSAPAGTLVAGVVAEQVAARWVENAVAGPVYVVSGQLRNAGRQAAPAGERVALRLLDAAGEPLGLPPVALGPALSVQELRERDPAELLRSQEQGSQRLARTPLGPGERWLFDAVLPDLPEAAARFRFEAVADPPGAEPSPVAAEEETNWEVSPPGSPPSPA